MNLLRRNQSTLQVFFLLALYLLSVIVHLGVLEFAGEEPRRAMISVEMLASKNFILPTQYGWDYYNKPPVFNWILALVIFVTGSVSEFVLRLPSIFFYCLMAYVHFRVSRHFFPKSIAVLSGFFVLTCADVYTYGLAYGAEIDIFYSLIVYLQAIGIFWFYRKRRYLLLYIVSYLFCAIGFLTKAFPSLVFQAFTLVALCVYARSAKPFFRREHIAGVFTFILITGVYFALYNLYSSPFRFLINLLNEAMLKSAVGEKSAKLFDKAVMYPWLFVKMFMPWSLLLLLLFGRIRYGFKRNPLVWFSLLFIAFNIWIYWLTGQPKIRYVYMFIPFGCTILTQMYCRFIETYPGQIERILKFFGFLFIIPFLATVSFPFISQTSLVWVITLSLSFLVLLYCFYEMPAKRVWLFLTGFMLLRLLYAALFIPLQRKNIESYNDHVSKVVTQTKKQDILYMASAANFPVAVNAKVLTYNFETIRMPPTLPLEIPYYLYRSTGKIMRFDTLPGTASYYIAYEWQLRQPVDTIYAYFDRNLAQRIVFYKLKNAH